MADEFDIEVDLPRSHGLQRPFDVLQYVAAFAYLLFGVSFAVLHAPMMPAGSWWTAVARGSGSYGRARRPSAER